jgi:hypothetical protein
MVKVYLDESPILTIEIVMVHVGRRHFRVSFLYEKNSRTMYRDKKL